MDTASLDERSEWLEADGLGGFASGTATGVRTRRYHALLLAATQPPAGRVVLVNGFEAWVETPAGSFPLSSQRYAPDLLHPDGARRIDSFDPEPWPRWRFRLEDGTLVEQEIFVCRGAAVVAVCWRALGDRRDIRLVVRPLLSGRNYHSLHHENPAFRFDTQARGALTVWRPYPGLPAVFSLTNGDFTPQPDWYRNFLYAEERARGLDCVEDLASPGTLSWDLSEGEAVWILAAEGHEAVLASASDGARGSPGARRPGRGSPQACLKALRAAERRRRGRSGSRLERAADSYLVRRGSGMTIVAGYPWFTDWGRDTFIALRGLCLATGRLDEAGGILLEWAGAVSEGMLPNRFTDHGEAPEYNSVDAALWYAIAVHDYLGRARALGRRLPAGHSGRLREAVESILSGYAAGTRYGIRLDSDGLLAAGQPGVQLTWMDAKVGDWVVTPRIGKPVEVQALWLNALRIGADSSPRWKPIFERGLESFRARMWNEREGYLYDVIDAGHQPGAADASLRPNQIFSVGGVPFPILEGERARRVVDAVEARLWTPLGLRSLAPGEAGYVGRYEGGVRERDGAYHQGTVWPWLLGPFVEGWVRVRGGTAAVRREARRRFLAPLLEHLDQAGLGHVSEIADGDPPHAPRGCPFQAWSVGEALRLDLEVLAEERPSPAKRRQSAAGKRVRPRAAAQG